MPVLHHTIFIWCFQYCTITSQLVIVVLHHTICTTWMSLLHHTFLIWWSQYCTLTSVPCDASTVPYHLYLVMPFLFHTICNWWWQYCTIPSVLGDVSTLYILWQDWGYTVKKFLAQESSRGQSLSGIPEHDAIECASSRAPLPSLIRQLAWLQGMTWDSQLVAN